MVSKTWGLSTHINLRNCDKEKIRDPKKIALFCKKLCDLLKLQGVGKINIRRFGKGRLNGYSMFQFIETSSISAHFDEQDNKAFIDIFSCKKYDSKKAGMFCKNFFNAESALFKVIKRF